MSCPSYSSSTISQWIYQQPKKNKNGGLSVNLQASSSQSSSPRVQLGGVGAGDRLRCPFGVQDGLEPSSRKNLEIAVSLDSLRQWALSIDEQNLQWIVDNSLSLFKKEMKRATVEALYRTLLTVPTNAAYDPLLRLKINSDGAQATNVMIVVQEGTATTPLKWRHGTLEDIERNADVIPIVEVTGLWFVSKGCGMTLVATDVLVFPKKKRGFDFSLPFAAGVVQCQNMVEEDQSANQPSPSIMMSVTGEESETNTDAGEAAKTLPTSTE